MVFLRVKPTDHKTRGRRLVLRYAGVQMAAAALVALVAGIASGPAAAGSALAGGAIVALGNVVFGWRLFAPGVARWVCSRGPGTRAKC